MPRIKTSDNEFALLWRRAGSLAEVATDTGKTRSQCSARAHYLRTRKGMHLPRFSEVSLLPDVLQVASWTWVRAPGLKRTHRRRPGALQAVCGTELGHYADDVPEGKGTACVRCWPVQDWPPVVGRLPTGALEVVVERRVGDCVFLVTNEAGQLVDSGTGRAYVGPILRSWSVQRQ
jgi:hypothetical protein